MNNIKNIIFDLGGVVIDLKREKAVEALKAIGFEGADEMLGLYRQQEPFLSLETGRFTTADFFDTIRGAIGDKNVSDRQIQDALNEFLRALPVERLEAIRELRDKGFRLFVLSNTNALMFHSWIEEKFRQEGLRVNDYFDGIVTSFQEGTCKPDPAIFETVLRRYGLKPEETLMLDDSQANCDAAESTGMKAIRIGTSADNDLLAVVKSIEK